MVGLYIVMAFRLLRTRLVIRIDGNQITLQKNIKSKFWEITKVITVTEDQRQFRLYTYSFWQQMNLPKKNIPVELSLSLSRIISSRRDKSR